MATADAQRDIKKVMIGTVALYLAPADTAPPADTVPLNGDWGSVWKHPGFTEEGVNFTFDRDVEDHYVEEQSNPALKTVSESDFQIEVGFVQDVLDNMLYAFGGGQITKVAAATGVVGTTTLKLSDNLNFMALGFEGKNPEGFWRRLYIPRVVATGSVETEFRRNEQKRVYPAEFHAVCRMDEIIWKNMDAAAL
jgi:hypothetical protein